MWNLKQFIANNSHFFTLCIKRGGERRTKERVGFMFSRLQYFDVVQGLQCYHLSPWFLRRAGKCMKVHIGFPSPHGYPDLKVPKCLALEYIKYFSHIGRGSITKYTLSVPAAGNSPPHCSIELSFPRLLYIPLCSAEQHYAEILVYKNIMEKCMLQETCLLHPASFHLTTPSEKSQRKYFLVYFTAP